VAAFCVFPDILLPDAQPRFSAGLWRFSTQRALQSRKTDVRTILEFQAAGFKRLRLNLDSEFAHFLDCVNNVKSICARTGCDNETYILDVHADTRFFSIPSSK